ncbi:succinate dehydrogenase cytochrome B subunit [Magnaporthiopsis poae ATCC 64411]|uniref:Succinate dehydrogenase cytochrome B subunit n=1 Tax=Magnaporthiopsis poae (strain ATCC 64411 / 73-15) TaxID=644358 RepID=A0A0C4DVP1_MAGP6|nr:succinate dehydrogenase cytochrome B subunit [Magnaporthiopsis poae ATCC 64411]
MSTQRVGLMAIRRAAQQPFFLQHIPRSAALSLQSSQARPLTTKLTQAENDALLAEQRLRRPVSPHLGIYDYKQTFFGGSIWQRITGTFLSATLYGFGAAYLAAPLTGWHLESASIAAAVGAWPAFAKGGLKFLIAWPFTFHSFNGVRHLVWDTARGFERTGLKALSRYVWVASVLSAVGLVAFF